MKSPRAAVFGGRPSVASNLLVGHGRTGHYALMAPGYELTEPQQKVAGWLSMGLALSTLPAIAIANVTKSWAFIGAYLAGWVVALAVMTAWVARTNQMTFAKAFVATLRRSRRSA